LEVIEVLKQGEERRSSDRRTYAVVQSFAPYNGFQLPRRSAFREIACRDLSTSGISLLLPARPDFQQAVFALGKGSRIVYVIGRVAHCDRCADPQDGFVVGCRFLSKVDLPF
jgi:hypothetical protein